MVRKVIPVNGEKKESITKAGHVRKATKKKHLKEQQGERQPAKKMI